VAAHAFRPLTRPFTSAVGLGVLVAGHATGWPVAEGGSRAVTRAMERVLRAHGGTVHTGVRVTDHRHLPSERT
jgi:phytoene dehydrogenase-like protein